MVILSVNFFEANLIVSCFSRSLFSGAVMAIVSNPTNEKKPDVILARMSKIIEISPK